MEGEENDEDGDEDVAGDDRLLLLSVVVVTLEELVDGVDVLEAGVEDSGVVTEVLGVIGVLGMELAGELLILLESILFCFNK